MSIEVKKLVKRFGAVTVCDELNLNIPSGELVALLGPSGSGKTSLLRIIAGLETPDGGSVLFNGEDATHVAVRERQVGFVFQHYALFGHMSIFENVAFGLRVRPKETRPSDAQIKAKVMELLKLVQLDWLADAYPNQLSGGQRQRLSIATALVHSPKVFFLDEPTTGLDPQARRNLWDLIKEVNARGVTVILTTHYLDEAELLCDRVAIMDRGKIIAMDTPKKLIKQLLDKGFKKEQHVEQANLEDVFIDLTGKGLRD